MRPNLVYKYRSGDKETFPRDLRSIKENCFYAPSIEELNDPCETLVYTDKFNFQTGLVKLLGNNSQEHLDIVKDALQNLINRREKIGIYSLSKTYNDELLWAHYANSHKGFCIEYDLDILINTYKYDNIYSFPVTYSNKPPQIGISEVSKQDGSSIIKKIACIKSKRWKYEKEHRIIIDRFGEYAYKYNAVKAIYFGLRMNKKNKADIMNILQGRGIAYYQMIQVSNSYKFDAEPVNDINDKKLTYLKEIPSSITRTTPVEYVINKKDYSWVNGKATIEITLEEKITKESLKWIALLIRGDIFKAAERIFMVYNVKRKEDYIKAWATTHFNPNLEVKILGSTDTEDKIMNKVSVDGDVIGKWQDTRPYADKSMILYEKNNKLFMKSTCKDGSSGDIEFIKKKYNDNNCYEPKQNKHNEYYLIEANGNLGIYDNEGKICEAIKKTK